MDPNNLIWIDLEMTGLDTQNDHIIEIATIVTDSQLNILAHGPEVVIHVDDSALDAMDEWNTRQHGESGLTERVRQSRIDCAEAETMTLDFLADYVPEGRSPMCGNSICQDRRFLAREMPRLEAWFHYRHIDVSTVKELVRRWYGDSVEAYEKSGNHRALGDIEDSIRELQFYRSAVFAPLPGLDTSHSSE